MIVGATVLALVLAVAFLHRQGASWDMVFSWFRGAAASQPRDEASKQQQRVNDEDARQRDGVTNNDQKSNGTAKGDEDSEDEATTPKAAPQHITQQPPIPTFALEAPKPPPTFNLAPLVDLESDSSSDEDDTDSLPPPQFPALNSAQRASGTSYSTRPSPGSMPPPAIPAPRLTTSNNLMAPPPRPSTARKPPTLSSAIPSLAPPPSGLRAPPSTGGPLPNRNPTSTSSARASLSAPLTTNVPVPNPRKKVQLTPGHSPLDWAALQRSGTNLAGVASLQRVTPSALRQHNGRKGRAAWAAYRGKVYNLSPYLPFHPGGEGELRRAAGKDGEKLFAEVHPWVNWDNMLEGCVVGIMVGEGAPRAGMGSALDEMD